MRALKTSLWLSIFLCSCAHGPLKLTSEHRYEDGFWSGFSARVVEYSHLAGDGRSLYFGTKGGRLYALSAENGAEQWISELLGPVDSKPGFSAGHVFVGTSKGRFYSLRDSDGGEAWHSDVPGEIIGQPVVLEDLVLFGANDGVLYALDAKTGEPRWRYRRDLPDRMTVHGFAAILGADGVVYAAFSDGGVAALKLSSGEPVWVKNLPAHERFSDVTALLLLDNQKLVAGVFDGALYSLARDGQVEWTFLHGGSAAAPVLLKDDLMVPMPGNKVGRLDPVRGEKKWEFDANDTARWSGLSTFGSHLLCASYEGKMYVLDPSSGKLKWTYDFGASIQGAPVVVGEKAWVLTRKGRLFSIQLR